MNSNQNRECWIRIGWKFEFKRWKVWFELKSACVRIKSLIRFEYEFEFKGWKVWFQSNCACARKIKNSIRIGYKFELKEWKVWFESNCACARRIENSIRIGYELEFKEWKVWFESVENLKNEKFYSNCIWIRLITEKLGLNNSFYIWYNSIWIEYKFEFVTVKSSNRI